MASHQRWESSKGGSRVGPVLSHWLNQERNGQIRIRAVMILSIVPGRVIEGCEIGC